MKNQITIALIIVIGIGAALVYIYQDSAGDSMNTTIENEVSVEQAFTRDGLKTNTEVASIDLRDVLDGGPGKDGIPALTNPAFISISEARNSIEPSVRGIFLSLNGEKRFYPYSILVWHEIVNDVVGDTPVLVTFCPLCGTAIVFDPVIDDEHTLFGVSGKLYESNLLMYDQKTESLWSQAAGEAVVGELTGTTLSYLPMQLITFEEVAQNHPGTMVLSTDTGYRRNYDRYPYGDYDTNEVFIFPVSVSDERLPSKELIYAVNAGAASLAIQVSALTPDSTTLIERGPFSITVEKDGGEILVSDSVSGERIPGYYSMWFSWATHHQESGYVWTGE